MGRAKKRQLFSGEVKAKVALEAVRGRKTVKDIAQDVGVHPTPVGRWKPAVHEPAASLFAGKRGAKPVDPSATPERRYAELGRLKRAFDWLKKQAGISP